MIPLAAEAAQLRYPPRRAGKETAQWTALLAEITNSSSTDTESPATWANFLVIYYAIP